MNRIKNYIKWVWGYDIVQRLGHTFAQAFVSVFFLGITGIIASVTSTASISDARMALIALVIASVAAGISAVKTTLVNYWENK